MPLYIGSIDQEQQPLRYFAGLMTEIRIWKGAREEKTIKAWELVANENGLVGYWPFDFDLALDFSPTRNPTQAITEMSHIALTALQYLVPVKKESLVCSRVRIQSTWSGEVGRAVGTTTLVFTLQMWALSYTRIELFRTRGNSVSWDWDDNTCATSFTFKLGSQDRYF